MKVVSGSKLICPYCAVVQLDANIDANNTQHTCYDCGKVFTYYSQMYYFSKQMESSQRANGCPICGENLIKRSGKYGQFYGCSTFPKCQYSAYVCPNCGLPHKKDIFCDKCGQDVESKKSNHL